MRARPLLALLLTAGLTGALATTAEAGSTAPGEARVRVTGELVRTSVERGSGTQWTAVRVDGRYLPVTPSGLAETPTGSTVTLDVAVPRTVVDAARTDRTLTVPSVGTGGAPATHPLTGADLAAASDATPAPFASDIGRASQDAALAPTAAPLQIDRVLEARAAPAARYTPATRAITYVEVTPRGATRSPVSKAQATSQVAAADSYWRDQSRGELKIGVPSVKPRYTSAYSCAEDPFKMWNEAAERTGFAGRANSSLVLSLPFSTGNSCGYGLGLIGANPNSMGVLHVADTRYPVLAHELGHNMSLGHANSLVCSGRSDALRSGGAWKNGCSEAAYGDSVDVMGPSGTSAPMLSAPQALRTGMLSPAAATSVGAGTSTVTLRPMAGKAGTRAAVVTHRRSGVKYWIEYRTASGRDASNPDRQSTGVRVLRTNLTTDASVLLDPTPTGRHDTTMSLTSGRTLTSYDGKITVTTVSTTSTHAVVRIVNSSTPGTLSLTSAPRITGTKGVGSRLTASTGSWSPTPSSYSYRWKRNGASISGATGRTYTPTTADAGRHLSVTVTAKRTYYSSKSSTSSRVGIPIHATKRPYLTGTAASGRTMTVMVGSWTPKPTSYAYQWYRNGRAISGRTSKTYTLGSLDKGAKVQAKVTARRSGYSTGTKLTYSTTVAR